MIYVIPAIIAEDFDELKEKIKKVEPYVEWAQLDIMDGRFVGNSTWNNPEELKNIKTNLGLEAHLMIKKPEEHLDKWIESGVRRIIFHFESTDKLDKLIAETKSAGLQVGVAINPETPVEKIESIVNFLDLVLVMAVNPGKSGQKFLKEILVKIRQLRQKDSRVNIEVDGGINRETAPLAVKAGANILASGSAIFNSDNIEEEIKRLKACT